MIGLSSAHTELVWLSSCQHCEILGVAPITQKNDKGEHPSPRKVKQLRKSFIKPNSAQNFNLFSKGR